MRLTIDEAYGKIITLMSYCATANMEYLASNECANLFKNILETIKEYKDIEKELGIDLITLFKANLKGVYLKGLKRKFPVMLRMGELSHKITLHTYDEYEKNITLKVEDYGKTWALTEEELL